MKRAILPALGLFLLLSIPAVSQDGGEDLRKEVDLLTKRVEEQDAALKQLQEYVDRHKAQAARLAKRLAAAEEGGFLTAGTNLDSKKDLLGGLQEFAAVAAGGKPAPEGEE
jgi:hypothetical protein